MIYLKNDTTQTVIERFRLEQKFSYWFYYNVVGLVLNPYFIIQPIQSSRHTDETYAMYQVSNMYHTKANGVVCRGQIFTVEDAKAIYDKHVRNINREITCWDVYVAVNAQYHDYIRMYKQWFPNLTEEQLDEKIIHSAINFWFEDEDAGSGKVWNYFKNI